VIGRTAEESSPAWPRPLRAEPGSPNVLFIVLDDVGYGQLGCYGSPIATPNLDALAAGGLLYSNMHTTALCSPSRSCIITGRNHHANATAAINELATGYPGYNGQIPFENGFLSEMLQQRGYSTYMVGKYHLMPSEFESAAGPFDRWPLGRGFERFYGFLGGDTSQWHPDLVYDNHQVEPPRTPEQGYHLTEDLADKAIEFITDAKQVAPHKPFYLHFCTGAGHAPHHVAKEWADRYEGQFDDGWDAYRERVFARQQELGILPRGAELSRHDPDVPEWKSLAPEARRLAARMMEVYAGFLSHTDHHIGRLISFLRDTGELDNTLIMVVSDNGASAEGGPTGTTNELQFFNNAPESLEESLAKIDDLGGPATFNHYPWGWTWAGNTPFRRWKRETYRGGTTDPFLVHWPQGIKARGEVRRQYAHVVDLVPTVLNALGLQPPAAIRGVTQSPLHGVSFAHSFDEADAPTRHRVQYFEMFGHRAIDHDGWRAVCPWPGPSFAEAGKYDVFPIDASAAERLMTERPQVAEPRAQYVFRPHTQTLSFWVGPRVLNRPHSITADAEIPDGGAAGVLICQGSNAGGWTFYVQDNRLHYAHNYVGREIYRVSAQEPLPGGRHQLRFEFEPTGKPDFAAGKGSPGLAQLYVDGQLIANAEFPVTTPIAFNPGGLTCGANPGSAIVPDYQAKAPFPYTGTLHTVTVDLSGDLITDTESEMRMAMARQ
jgi:arylsulfatase